MVVDGVVDAVVAEREAEGQSADWLFVGLDFLKATPHTEGERRFVHFEASNDALDKAFSSDPTCGQMNSLFSS